MASVKEETISGAKWGLIQKFTMQPVQFIYGVILARLITPEEFGIMGLTAIFFAIAGQLQNCGFGAALIRKQDRTETDCSTMFWYNVGASFVLSGCLFLAAPWFAAFFHQPALVNLTRVSALMMFLNSTASVHMTLYQARRDFKTPAVIGIISTIIPMPFTIWAAYEGWSYWSLMVQSVLSGLLSLIIVWIVSPWKPRLIWSNAAFKSFFGFGIKIVATGLLDSLYLEGRSFLIGKFYSPSSLGNYNKGGSLVTMSSSLLNSVLSGVIYPILATIQGDEERLVAVYRKYIRLNNIVAQFLLLTMAANSRPLILFLYGDSWEEAYNYAQILCIGLAVNQLSSVNSNLYMVKGRTDIILNINVILRIFAMSTLLLAAFHSVIAICWASALSGVMWLLLCMYYTTKISSLNYRIQLADFGRYVLFAAISNLPSIFLSQLAWHPFFRLALAGTLALGIYIGALLLVRDEIFLELCVMLQDSRYMRKLQRWVNKASS